MFKQLLFSHLNPHLFPLLFQLVLCCKKDNTAACEAAPPTMTSSRPLRLLCRNAIHHRDGYTKDVGLDQVENRKPDARAAISLKLEWILSEMSRASLWRCSTAVIQRDQLIHRGLRNPFVRWRGDTQLQQTDETAEVTVCSSEWLYEGRNKQAARTRWQRPAGGFTGMFSALERKASREDGKKQNRNVTFFSFIAQWGA